MNGHGTGEFVISIDLEMSWGSVHHGRPHDASPYAGERRVVEDVLSLMEKYGMTATWAVVGHLFLTDCTGADGVNHGDIVRPDYPWLDMDWYDLDPASSLQADPTWYGPDLIAAIRRSAVPHEIGSHSFGHIIAGEPGCSAAAFESDLIAAKAVAEVAGIDLRSFVYPRNSIGHLDVLERHGFTAYRGPAPRPATGSGMRSKLLRLADAIRPGPTSAAQARRRGGLVDVPQTFLFDPGSKKAERFGTAVWGWLARRRLRHAVRNGSIFHMWFHTHNLATNPERAMSAMDRLFAEARRHIDAGDLENLTMGQIADRLQMVQG